MQVFLNVLLKISQYLVPILINFVDKHKDEYLQKLSDKLLKKLDEQEEEKMSTLRVETNNGATVEFNLGQKGIIRRTAEEGIASVSGLGEEDNVTVTVILDGYKPEEVKVNSVETDKVLVINLQKLKDVETVIEKTTETLMPVVEEVIKDSVINITNIQEAKDFYKNITNTIKKNQELVDNALKVGAYDVVQSAGSAVIYAARQQLTDSIEYYVNLRHGINPFGSWVNFRNYTEYTSMIAGLYLLRANLVKWLDKVLGQLENL